MHSQSHTLIVASGYGPCAHIIISYYQIYCCCFTLILIECSHIHCLS
jgi:hypothetical protein